MNNDNQRVTLTDVANHAGVSPASVSRVLNNTGPVSDDMRERVEESLAELGYEHVPQRSTSRSLQGRLGVLIADIENPFFAEVLRGIGDESDDAGLVITLLITMEEIQREERLLDALGKRSVEGLILSGSRLSSQRLIEYQERFDIPFVLLNRKLRHDKIACILIDQERTAYRAAQHLINLNHTRIAYLAGPNISESSQARGRGIERAMAEANLALRHDQRLASFPSIEGGFQAMSALLAQPADERPTAVIAYNDMMALGALDSIRTHGLQVPDDISVVGFDDIAIAAHANPPLTTVAQPKYKMGTLAVRTLLQMQAGEPVPANGFILLESPLIVRDSTARCSTE